MNPNALFDLRIAIPVALSLLYSLLWAMAAWQTLQRGRALWKALDDSTRSRLDADRTPGVSGFAATLQPAVEPFQHLATVYQPVSIFTPAGVLLRPFMRGQERLLFWGTLHSPPQSELLWVRGNIPAVASGIGARTQLWQQRRLDVLQLDYAVRGSNVGAIETAFRTLQSRFAPLLMVVRVQAHPDRMDADLPVTGSPFEPQPVEVAIVLRSAELSLSEIPALVNAVRALGRAALLA